MDNFKATRFGQHSNSLGFLRLLFASLVILSHTPELIDGNRNRELLTRLFGTLSFGEFAVDAFFIISGYLIVASFVNARSPVEYLRRRVARIYPGFLMAYALAVLVVAPLGGASLPHSAMGYASVVVRAVLLQVPDVGPVFDGLPHPFLNGAAWTIAFEFRCYLLVMVLGLAGVFERRWVVLLACAALLILSVVHVPPARPVLAGAGAVQAAYPDLASLKEWKAMLIGDFRAVRLTGMFLAGSCFFLFADRVRFRAAFDVLAVVLLCAGLSFERTVNPAMAVFGAYLIFRVGHIGGGHLLSRINNRNDVSYGLYLYAWPVTKLILWYQPAMPTIQVGLLTFVLAYGLGWASWLGVEKPMLARIKRGPAAA